MIMNYHYTYIIINCHIESHLKLTKCVGCVDQAGVGPDTAYYMYELFAHM